MLTMTNSVMGMIAMIITMVIMLTVAKLVMVSLR